MTRANETLTLALPKGRILREAMPLLHRAGIVPEAEFEDENSRKLSFATNHPHISGCAPSTSPLSSPSAPPRSALPATTC